MDPGQSVSRKYIEETDAIESLLAAQTFRSVFRLVMDSFSTDGRRPMKTDCERWG